MSGSALGGARSQPALFEGSPFASSNSCRFATCSACSPLRGRASQASFNSLLVGLEFIFAEYGWESDALQNRGFSNSASLKRASHPAARQWQS